MFTDYNLIKPESFHEKDDLSTPFCAFYFVGCSDVSFFSNGKCIMGDFFNPKFGSLTELRHTQKGPTVRKEAGGFDYSDLQGTDNGG